MRFRKARRREKVTEMGVLIEKLHRMDGYHDRHFGTVRHSGQMLQAVLVGPYDQLLTVLNTDVGAEYDLNEILSVELNLPPDDEASGFFPKSGDQIVVDGTVYNETVIDDIFSLFDIYIRNGADFVSIPSEDLPARPQLDTRIRVTGKGLHVYPTFS